MLDTASADLPVAERFVVRFGATLIANVLRGMLSFATGILIARGLGAAGYGDLNFLLASFIAVGQLLDVGALFAFYTFISQRRRPPIFFGVYLAWMAFQFLATAFVVGLLLPGSALDRIWLGHDRRVVLLAFGASFLTTQVWGMVSHLGEASRKTVIVQAVAVAQAVVHLALLAGAVYLRWLTVQVIMWLLVGEYALLAAFLGPRLLRENLTHVPRDSQGVRIVIKEFIIYCRPLVVYAWVGFFYAFADRWLLQQFGGAEQQGFFSVGQQFANISMIATASILKVFWKEVAVAREWRDHERVERLYLSVSRGLYFAAAWISCLLIPYSQEILLWTVGPRYEAAWISLGLMLLYPIHQSLGQIQGTFFYASHQTGTYAKIGLLMMGVSVPVTYLMLAPPSAAVPGVGLAAAGLAVKMVALQIVGVGLQGYVIGRSNGWRSDYWHQGIVLVGLLALGWVGRWAGAGFLDAIHLGGGAAGVMLVGGLLYCALSLTVLYRAPELAGLSREEILRVRSAAARWWRSAVTVKS